MQIFQHIERTRILVFLIDIIAENPSAQYETLLKELASYSQVLIDKPRCLVFSKMDLVPKESDLPQVQDKRLFMRMGISALTGLGLDSFLRLLTEKVYQVRVR